MAVYIAWQTKVKAISLGRLCCMCSLEFRPNLKLKIHLPVTNEFVIIALTLLMSHKSGLADLVV